MLFKVSAVRSLLNQCVHAQVDRLMIRRSFVRLSLVGGENSAVALLTGRERHVSRGRKIQLCDACCPMTSERAQVRKEEQLMCKCAQGLSRIACAAKRMSIVDMYLLSSGHLGKVLAEEATRISRFMKTYLNERLFD